MAIINRETDYAIRILRSLSDGDKKPISQICEQEAMAKPFTYKICKKLEKAGLIDIQRGPDGGCRLAADLKQLTLYDLMLAIDDSQILIDCMRKGYVCEYTEHNTCRVHCSMSVLQQKINDQLKSYSILDLLS